MRRLRPQHLSDVADLGPDPADGHRPRVPREPITPREPICPWGHRQACAGTVRIYSDYDAFQSRDLSQGWALKPYHDKLYQVALDLYLAAYVVLIQNHREGADGLPHTVMQDRPLWWPANRRDKNRDRLISVSLNYFGRKWLTFRTAAETELRCEPLWLRDPALFEKQRGADYYLCRACCVGHEGYVHYFVYPYEDEWEQALISHGLELPWTGEEAYRALIPEPGKVGGR